MSLLRRRDFYAYILLILLSTPVIGLMMADIWRGGGYQTAVRIVNTLPILPEGDPGVQAVACLSLALYLTFLFLFTNDFRKRYQGRLLWLATIVALATMAVEGIFLPNIELTLINAAAALGGVLVALGLEVLVVSFDIGPYEIFGITLISGHEIRLEGDVRYLSLGDSSLGAFKTGRNDWAEFPIASWGIVLSIATAVIGSLLLGYAQVTPLPVMVVWAGASTLFLGAMYGFVSLSPEYEESQLEILGPEQSGKTLSIYGLYQAASVEGADPSEMFLTPRGDMEDLLKRHDTWDGEGWPFESTGNRSEDQELHEFEFLAGDRFPKIMTVSMKDHAGEHLERLPERLAGTAATSILLPDGGEDGDPPVIDLDGKRSANGGDGEDDDYDHDSDSSDEQDQPDDTEEDGSDDEDWKGNPVLGPGAVPGSAESDEGREGDGQADSDDFGGQGFNVASPQEETDPVFESDTEDLTASGQSQGDDESEASDSDHGVDEDSGAGASEMDSDPKGAPDDRSGSGDQVEAPGPSGQTDSTGPEGATEDGLSANAQNLSDISETPDTDTESGSPSGGETASAVNGTVDELNDTAANVGNSAEQVSSADETITGDDRKGSEAPSSDNTAADAGTSSDEMSDGQEEAVDEMVDRVRNADILVLLVDCERLVGKDVTGTENDSGNPDLQIEDYVEILSYVEVDRAVLVASKADVLLEEWDNPYPEPPSENPDALKEFTEYTTNLVKGSQMNLVTRLMQAGNASAVYPVYYQTEEKKKGEETVLVPRTDDSGPVATPNLQPVGYEQVLESIAGNR